MKNPAELFLILKKEFFLEILKGRKKEEYRDFTDYYIDRLCEFDKDGQCIGVKKYETVKFQLGYSKHAPKMIVEFKSVSIESDDDGAEEFTSENSNFVIELGEVLEKENCESLL